MVKRVQKVKTASLKSGSTLKRGAAKTKKEEKVPNGVKNKELADIETAEPVITESNEAPQESNALDVDQNMTEAARQEESPDSEEATSSNKNTLPKSRKRRAAPEVVEKKGSSKTTTKAKKQKVLIEIPRLSSVSGKVFVIGSNELGQLGFDEDIIEKKKPTLLETVPNCIDIAAGGMHSVCLTESGEVFTFGCNDEGALGRNTEEGSEYIPSKVQIPERIVQISAGDSHSAALSESGQVYLWGNFRNQNGPMGIITSGKSTTPVRLLTNMKIVKISSGCDHVVCLTEDGDVYTCGSGEAGQLGRVSEHSSVDGGRKGLTLLLEPDKVPIRNKSKVNNIWTSSFATFVNVRESGAIFAFGLNNYGQLGVEIPLSDNLSDNPKPIFKPKQIIAFENKSWSKIIGGQNHTVSLDDEGLVYSLGRSEYGRLGLGENSGNKSAPTVIPTLQSQKCTEISCGSCVSFAVTDTGSVFSWGMGTNYQLGLGNDNDQFSPRRIEGDFSQHWKAFKISGGGQHTLILAQPRESLEENQ